MKELDFEPKVDVLVIGAGPVGLLTAAELALGGVSVEVLERTVEASSVIKAGSINLASAEILARRGLLSAARKAHNLGVRKVAEVFESAFGLTPEESYERARQKVERAGHFAAIHLDSVKLRLDDPDVSSHLEALDATLVVQREVEIILEQHAGKLGVPVRRGVEAVAIQQTGEAVEVRTSIGECLKARYVVGCDGGRSAVRKACEFDFPGTDPEITGRQAVVELDDPSLLKFGWQWSLRGVYRYGPTPGVVLTVEFDGPPADRASDVTADEIEQSLQRTSGTEVRVKKLLGKATRWTDNARQASNYRKGRVFLAGDAAHVHSPFSGQGLNCGLGDATNLGWKLAAVCRGLAPESLLDTYSTERHPVGAWVLDWTRGQVAVMRPDVKVAQTRATITNLMNTSDGMTLIVNKISGVTQRIDLPGNHRLIGSAVPDIALEDGRSARDLFVDGKFVFVDVTDGEIAATVARNYGARIEIACGRFNMADTSVQALLARPDGVIVWIAERGIEVDKKALLDTLRSWAGAPIESSSADSSLPEDSLDHRPQSEVEVGGRSTLA